MAQGGSDVEGFTDSDNVSTGCRHIGKLQMGEGTDQVTDYSSVGQDPFPFPYVGLGLSQID